MEQFALSPEFSNDEIDIVDCGPPATIGYYCGHVTNWTKCTVLVTIFLIVNKISDFNIGLPMGLARDS